MKAFPKDIEVQSLRERHIGVESELGIKNMNPNRDLPPGLEEKLNAKGLLLSVGFDGGGREFRTVPIAVKALLQQKRGYQYFQGYYLELSHYTEILPSGGTHIHISILDSDHDNIEANAIALATAFHSQFQKVSGRKSSWAGKLYVSDFDQVKTFLDNNRYGKHLYYAKGSMLAPTRHKTLEFRGPRGSNNPVEILAWVDFVNTVVKVANRASVEGVKFADLLMGTYISEYIKSLKFTKGELNQTINLAHF